MKRRNPFDVVSRLRAIDERQARAALAHAQSAHRAARERLEEHARAKLTPLIPSEVLSPIELRSLHLRGIQGHEALMEAAEAAHRAELRAEAKAAEWRRASDDLEAAERLRTKRQEEIARNARKAAERSLDDLVATLWTGDDAA